MARKSFSSEEKNAILEEHKDGLSVQEICRKYSISDTTFYKWRTNSGFISSVEHPSSLQLRRENARLKTLLAEKVLRIDQLEKLSSANS